MPLYGPSTATATVAANTNVVSITGMDLNAVVQQGMTINLGARDRAVGDAWIINAVTPNGTNGGTLTTAGSIPTAYNSVPFLIDTRGFLGTDSSYAAAVSLKLLSTLSNLLGAATNLFSGARQLVLDKVASTALGRIVFSTAGRSWGDIVHRAYSYTPTGGQARSVETLALRAFADGSTPTDALLLDLSTGTGDLRQNTVAMTAAPMTDLGSAPAGRVAITSLATITSFGSGRNLHRLVYFADNDSILKHNATSLILPGRKDIVVRAGDCLYAVADNAGNWQVLFYQRADGTALRSSTVMTNYTPPVSSGSGTISTLGPCTGRWQMLTEKVCFVQIDVAISNNGTGAGFINVGLPFQCSDKYYPGCGREIALNGYMLEAQTIPGSAQAQVFRYDNTYPGGSGVRLVLSFVYEVAL